MLSKISRIVVMLHPTERDMLIAMVAKLLLMVSLLIRLVQRHVVIQDNRIQNWVEGFGLVVIVVLGRMHAAVLVSEMAQ